LFSGIRIHARNAILAELNIAEQSRRLSELDESGQLPVRFFDQTDLFDCKSPLRKIGSDGHLGLVYVALTEFRTGTSNGRKNKEKEKDQTCAEQQGLHSAHLDSSVPFFALMGNGTGVMMSS
jgi:hypothetical protein